MLERCILCLLAGTLIFFSGCALKKKQEPAGLDARALVEEPLRPEEAEELLAKSGEDFLYGPGLGEAAVNVGGVVLFPPYGIYLLGNALLSLGGYEPVSPKDALPEEGRERWDSAYQKVVNSPGKVAAAISGREFRTSEVIDRDLSEWIEDRERTVEYPD